MSIQTQHLWETATMYANGSSNTAEILSRPVRAVKSELGNINGFLNVYQNKTTEKYDKTSLYSTGYIVRFDGLVSTEIYSTNGLTQIVNVNLGNRIYIEVASGTTGTSTLNSYYEASTAQTDIDLDTEDFTNVTNWTLLVADVWVDYIALNDSQDSGNPPLDTNIGTYWEVLTQAHWETIFYFKDDADIKFINADLPGTTEVMQGSLQIQQDLVVEGGLTVNGTTTTLNTVDLVVSDNKIILNNDVTGVPTEDAGLIIERGTSLNSAINWNETSDKFEVTEDGTNYYDIINENSLTTGTQSGLSLTYDGINVGLSVNSVNINLSGEVTSDAVSIDHTGAVTISNVSITDFDERAQDAVGISIGNGINNNITATYDDVANGINFDVRTIYNVTTESNLAAFTPDTSLADVYNYSMNQDTVIELPLNYKIGQTGTFIVSQDEIGGHTLNFDAYLNNIGTLNTLQHTLNTFEYTVLDADTIILTLISTITPNILIQLNVSGDVLLLNLGGDTSLARTATIINNATTSVIDGGTSSTTY